MNFIDKYLGWIIVGTLTFIITIAIILGSVSASYQSQMTGYSFWQCFWAGDTIKNVNVKIKK